MPPRRRLNDNAGRETQNTAGRTDQADVLQQVLERMNDTLRVIEQRLGALPPPPVHVQPPPPPVYGQPPPPPVHVQPPPPPMHAPPPPPPYVVQLPVEYDPYQVEFMALLRQMQHCQAQMFTGEIKTPLEAENWLRLMEKNFECIGCPEVLKVRMIVFYLRDDADHWWGTVKLRYPPGHQFTWGEFCQEYGRQYFPPHSRGMMVQKFLELKQEDMTVTAYASRFRRLLRYAEHTVPTEVDRVDKFMKGLRPSIRVSVCELLPSVSFCAMSASYTVFVKGGSGKLPDSV